MEPKNPIYIDGVDVSECFHYVDNCKEYSCKLEYSPFYSRRCEECKNCYFKQYSRKEYECQRTEQKLILIRDFITDVQIRSSASSVCDKILQIIDEVDNGY